MTFAIFQGIGPVELGVVLLIVLLIFGPKRLPSLGRQLGSGMREFKDSITGRHDDDDDDLDGDVARRDAGGADTVRKANTALGRPDEAPAADRTDSEIASERR